MWNVDFGMGNVDFGMGNVEYYKLFIINDL